MTDQPAHRFRAELWAWDARPTQDYALLSLPEEVAADVEDVARSRPRAGFTSVPVEVTIGGSTWRTSVFGGSDGSYVLPVKRAVRRAEGVGIGDVVEVRLRPVAD